ncbi:MAG: 50S ribosomal protein L24 [Actinomycetota bacterium]|jgi:large subunit ribosomal protein L24
MPGVGIRKDDEIQVVSGKDRGARGRVVRVLPREGRIMVEGIARAKKHARASKRRQQGGIIDVELFIDISNVQLVCKTCGQVTRIGHRVEDGKRIRVCRKCEADL